MRLNFKVMSENNIQQNGPRKSTKPVFIIYGIVGILVILYFSLFYHHPGLARVFGIILGAGILLVSAVSIYFESKWTKNDNSPQ